MYFFLSKCFYFMGIEQEGKKERGKGHQLVLRDTCCHSYFTDEETGGMHQVQGQVAAAV
jgi:hypothetical protein